MRNRQQCRLGRARDVRIRRSAVFRDNEGTVSDARVVDEEATVRPISWVEREAEQSPLTTGENLGADIEKRRWCRESRPKDLDDSCLLDDEEPVRAIASVPDEHRCRQST